MQGILGFFEYSVGLKVSDCHPAPFYSTLMRDKTARSYRTPVSTSNWRIAVPAAAHMRQYSAATGG